MLMAMSKKQPTFETSPMFKNEHGRSFLNNDIHAAPAYPALLKIDGTDTRREHKLTAGTVKTVHPCTFLTYVFALQTRY